MEKYIYKSNNTFIDVSNKSYISDLQIESHDVINKKITIENYATNIATLYILNTKFKDFELSLNNKIDNIIFINCSFENCIIDKIDCTSILFENSYGKKITFYNMNLLRLKFESSFFNNFEFKSNSNISKVGFSFYKWNKFENTNYNNYINSNIINPEININLNTLIYKNFYFVQEDVEDVNENIKLKLFLNKFKFNITLINLYRNYSPFVHIKEAKNIDNFIFIGIFEDVIIEKSIISHFIIDNLIISKLILKEIRPFSFKKSSLILLNSIFQNTYFYNIDFNKYERVDISGVNIEDIKFYNTLLPFNLDNNKIDEKYEIYRQFVKSYNNSFDIEKATIAKSKQLDQLRKLYQTKRGNYEQKIIFLLSRYSNNFGLDWRYSLNFIIIIPFLLYLVYLLSLKLLYINFYSVSYDWNIIFSFFDFINPTHSSDFLVCKKTLNEHSFSKFIDFITRIIVGFGIYQFITAFRRYGK